MLHLTVKTVYIVQIIHFTGFQNLRQWKKNVPQKSEVRRKVTSRRSILKIEKGLGTERARLRTFRGFGTERARLGAFRGFGTESTRLGSYRCFGPERA